MTAYVCLSSASLSAAYYLAIQAGSYELRLTRVDFQTTISGGGSYHTFYSVYRYSTFSMSGSSVPLIAARQGAPAASATGKGGTTAPTGTSSLLSYTVISDIGAGNYQPPTDITISPGSAIVVGVGWQGASQSTYINIAVEELRLSWSY